LSESQRTRFEELPLVKQRKNARREMSNPSEKGVGDDGSWLEAQDAREGEGVAETSPPIPSLAVSTCPPPRSLPPPLPVPLFGPGGACNFNFAPFPRPPRARLPHRLDTLSLLLSPLPAGRSLISIFSRRVESIARISSYTLPHSRMSSLVVCSMLCRGQPRGMGSRKCTRNVRQRSSYVCVIRTII